MIAKRPDQDVLRRPPVEKRRDQENIERHIV